MSNGPGVLRFSSVKAQANKHKQLRQSCDYASIHKSSKITVYPKFTCPDCTESNFEICCLFLAAWQKNPLNIARHFTMNTKSSHCFPEGSHPVGQLASCYTLNHFFRLLFDGLTLYIPYCGVLVAAAECLPPGALNLQGAPAFANFWTNTNSKRIKTMHNGKSKAPLRSQVHWDFLMNMGALGLLVRRGH